MGFALINPKGHGKESAKKIVLGKKLLKKYLKSGIILL